MASGSADIKTGFWIGLGLSLALLVWSFASMLLGKVASP